MRQARKIAYFLENRSKEKRTQHKQNDGRVAIGMIIFIMAVVAMFYAALPIIWGAV
jgi:heme/copper-type cytochrome/quinol oxidase subunit 3